MKDLIHLVAAAGREWGSKTLDDLRYEAAGEESGISYGAIRRADGKRVLIAICVTEPHDIEHGVTKLKLGGDVSPADWSKVSLADFVARSFKAGGLTYEDYWDGNKHRVALAIAAAGRPAAELLECLYHFPD